TDRGKLLYDAVADAWWLRHGRVFAARATVELFGLDHEDDQGRTTRLAVLPEGGSPQRLWLRRGAADRVRTLLSTAAEGEYREVVAALAAHRGGARRRIVVSYLVPGETGWVAECCADPGESGREERAVRAMLFESLNDEEQLRALLRAGGVSAYDGRLDTAATVAEGVGPAVAALIAEIWRYRAPSYG
ncbi:MolR family transcriptional regulator, partial [Streptomyces sp. 2MCAF27]